MTTEAIPDSAAGTQLCGAAKPGERKGEWRPFNKSNPCAHGLSVYDDEAVVSCLNKIFIRNKSVPTKNESAGDFHQFEFLPKVERRPSQTVGVSITVQADGRDQPFTVILNPVFFDWLLEEIDPKLGELDIKQMPEPIKCAIAEALFATTIEKIEQWGKTRIEIKTIHDSPVRPEANGYYLSFRALFGRTDKVTEGQICLQKEHLQWLAQAYDTQALPHPAFDIERLPLNVSLIAGKTRLPLKDIQSLESMDIVVLDKYGTTRGPQKLSNAYVPNGVYLYAQREDDEVVVTQIGDDPMNEERKKDAPGAGYNPGGELKDAPGAGYNPGGELKDAPGAGYNPGGELKDAPGAGYNPGGELKDAPGAGYDPGGELNNAPGAGYDPVGELNDAPGAGSGPGDEFNIEDINIDLLFELGRKQMPLKELKTVRPGYIFNVGEAQNTVEVIVNGSKIGSGELVLLGERIGVRLLEFSFG